MYFLSARKQDHEFNNFISFLLSYNLLSINQQASDIISISEQYIDQHLWSLWSSINFRALSSPEFNKPLVFYQFQRNTQPRIHQTSDFISTSDHYTSQHSTSLLYSNNFRSLYSKCLHSNLTKSNSFLIHSLRKYNAINPQ